MHLCFLNLPIEFYSPVSGGALSTIIAQSARELVALGHRVSVLSAVDGNPVYEIGDFVPLRYPQPREMNFVRRKVSGLRRRLAGWDWPGFDVYLSAARSAIRSLPTAPESVIVFNDLVTQRYLRDWLPNAAIFSWLQNEWRTRNHLLDKSIAATDRFLTCSSYIADWTSSNHNIHRSKFEVVLSGVNLDEFKPATVVPHSDLRVLFVGRIDPNKGPDIAVTAVEALQREGLPVTFTVAGARWFYGDSEDKYTVEFKSRLDAVNATYLGHVPRDRIAGVFQQADVVCVLSRSNEPFGLVVLEAMAAGCAVLASNRGGLPEACGGAAVVVNPDDIDSVTNALRSLARNPTELTALKAASLRRASAASWANVARLLHEITASVLEENKG